MSAPHAVDFSLAGRTALVTGARGGIGRVAALALAAAGADVVLWGRERAATELVAVQARALGRRAEVVTGDLGDLDATERTATTLAASTRIDVLVNNAGTISRGPASEVSLTEWQDVLRINLDSAFVLARCFGTPMVERGHGAIVNVASLLSFQGGLTVPAYTASKHALVGLTKALANEWAPHGVNVNAVAPGYISTDNTAALRADPEREPAIRSRIPAGRWGEPADIAGAVVFLAGPAASYVHGHTLVVDGGWLGR